MTKRAQAILGEWQYFVDQPLKELQARIERLKAFEIEKAELENEAYVLLLGVPENEFERLFGILESNFESLKGLRAAGDKVQQRMKDIISAEPSLKESTQAAIVAWAASQFRL